MVVSQGCRSGVDRRLIAGRLRGGVEVGEVRPELLGGDLLVGGPGRLLVDLRAPAEAGDDARSEVQRLLAGQQRAAEDRIEGWRPVPESRSEERRVGKECRYR